MKQDQSNIFWLCHHWRPGNYFLWFQMSWYLAPSGKSRQLCMAVWSCIQLAMKWAGQGHWEELRNTSHVPPRCRQRGFLQKGWSLSKLLGIPGPTKSSCQTKVCIPRKCSRSSCHSSHAVALLRTSSSSVENKMSPMHSSWILLRKRPHCNTAP